MNYNQQIMHLRKSRGLIIICLLSIVLVLTTAFIAIQAEAAPTGSAVSAESIDSGSIGQSNKNFAVAGSVFTSDDFNNCTLDTDLWTFLNPAGDGSLAMNGTQAILSVPSGTIHTIWVTGTGDFINTVPRLVQTVDDVDFELEVKFEADLSQQYQLEGVLIEQDANDVLRLEFYHDGSNLVVFAASFTEGAPEIKHNMSITNSNPLYMRVTRVGDEWTQRYSYDGVDWTAMTSFTRAMTVTTVSAYVGNDVAANTVAVDYVYNTAAPGTGDVPLTLTVNSVGQGTVSKDPDKSSYDCNEVVELEATPATGWSFSDWSGDVISTANPISLTITSSHVVTAHFADNTPPDTMITDQPPDPSNSADASFSFTSTKSGSTFECQLDSGGFSTCTTPKAYTGLADGAHTFDVRAIDGASNPDPTPASYSWTIDTVAPDTTITAQPPNPSNSANASFSFTSTETGSTFECQLDSGGFSTCTTPKAYTGLAEGAHTFEVRAIDGAGNTDPSPASYSWTIDTVAPDTTITAQPPDPSDSADASFSFTSTETGSTFECQLDSGGFSTCTTPKAYTGLVDGAHTFEVRAIDGAGNTDPSPASYSWTIDTVAPDTTITAQPPDPSNSADASFSFTSTETGSTFECQLDSGGFSTCTTPKAYTGLADGAHTFQVRATDGAGNTDPSPASYSWTIDTDAPNTTITAQPPDPSNSADASFSFTSTETGSTFECQLDSGGFSTCTTPKAYTGLDKGDHIFEVRATDGAGNTDPTPASYSWTIYRATFLPIIMN